MSLRQGTSLNGTEAAGSTEGVSCRDGIQMSSERRSTFQACLDIISNAIWHERAVPRFVALSNRGISPAVPSPVVPAGIRWYPANEPGDCERVRFDGMPDAVT